MDANLLQLIRIIPDRLRIRDLIISLVSVAQALKASRLQLLYFKTFFNKTETATFTPRFKEVHKMDSCRSGKQPATHRHCLLLQQIPVLVMSTLITAQTMNSNKH